jgi:hypothetical protein
MVLQSPFSLVSLHVRLFSVTYFISILLNELYCCAL